eukprot:1052591-Alexandrium_andersonii.AAC.1
MGGRSAGSEARPGASGSSAAAVRSPAARSRAALVASPPPCWTAAVPAPACGGSLARTSQPEHARQPG